MNKLLSLILAGIFLISLVAADVSLESSSNALYNLGDHIEFLIKVTPVDYFEDLLILKLKCGTLETEIYKEYIITDVELERQIKIPLIKNFIGESKGTCEIIKKIGFNEQKLSNEFIISNRINIYSEVPTYGITPGETISINGTAVKENGDLVEGTIEIISNGEEGEILKSGFVENGEFSLDLQISNDFKAGDRVLKFYVYEKDRNEEIINSGISINTIVIRQVPTNIEIVVEEKEVMPGSSLKARVLLHDQTGEKIDSEVYVAIKDSLNNIVDKIETRTDTVFEYEIKNSEAPGRWSLSAYSENIINSDSFVIKINEQALFNLVNNTLFVKNIGNVLYNETVNITVGNKIIELPFYLEIGEEEKYSLSAPTGEYDVLVGDIQERISLTGNAIKIKKVSGTQSEIVKISVWVFIILILGLMAYVVFKKGHKKNFFGRIGNTKKKVGVIELDAGKQVPHKGLVNPKVKTELSLSINGTKQNAVVGCVFLKNYEEIKSGEGNVGETLESVSNFIESHKGLIYKNHGHLFFILAPVLTKTFQNEESGLKIASEIVKDLKIHNKKFKKKIEFGISLNYGTIVTKIGVHANQFMSMGTLMTDAKKMANASNEEIYLGEKVRERLGSKVKVELKQIGSVKAYEIKELVSDRKDYSPFLKGFVERQQKERLIKENELRKAEMKKE
jgi:hypothetical protein